MAATKCESIDAYLAGVSDTQRESLTNLRAQIKERYPQATEHISYGHPLFKLDGHPLGGFSAHKRHCSFFVWSKTALGTIGDLLEGYDIAESTVRFTPDQPLGASLIRAILDLRAQEIRDRWGDKTTAR